MAFVDFLSTIVNSIKPIKTIFSFYVALYLFPICFFLIIGYEAKEHLFVNDTEINIAVATLLGICATCVVIWSVFFLIYFTRQRTKNPQLYNRGFLSEFSVKDKEDEFNKNGSDSGRIN